MRLIMRSAMHVRFVHAATRRWAELGRQQAMSGGGARSAARLVHARPIMLEARRRRRLLSYSTHHHRRRCQPCPAPPPCTAASPGGKLAAAAAAAAAAGAAVNGRRNCGARRPLINWPGIASGGICSWPRTSWLSARRTQGRDFSAWRRDMAEWAHDDGSPPEWRVRHKPWPLPTQHTLGTLALSRPSGTEAQLLMIFDAIVRSAAEPLFLGEGDDEDESGR